MVSAGLKRMTHKMYLVVPQPGPRKQFRRMIVGPAVIRLFSSFWSIQSSETVRVRLTIFEVDIGSKVHFRRTCLED
jgi:hypothetical protein